SGQLEAVADLSGTERRAASPVPRGRHRQGSHHGTHLRSVRGGGSPAARGVHRAWRCRRMAPRSRRGRKSSLMNLKNAPQLRKHTEDNAVTQGREALVGEGAVMVGGV